MLDQFETKRSKEYGTEPGQKHGLCWTLNSHIHICVRTVSVWWMISHIGTNLQPLTSCFIVKLSISTVMCLIHIWASAAAVTLWCHLSSVTRTRLVNLIAQYVSKTCRHYTEGVNSVNSDRFRLKNILTVSTYCETPLNHLNIFVELWLLVGLNKHCGGLRVNVTTVLTIFRTFTNQTN